MSYTSFGLIHKKGIPNSKRSISIIKLVNVN